MEDLPTLVYMIVLFVIKPQLSLKTCPGQVLFRIFFILVTKIEGLQVLLYPHSLDSLVHPLIIPVTDISVPSDILYMYDLVYLD